MATANTDELHTLSESKLTVKESAEDVRGRKVFDKEGNHIGSVEDLMVDATESKVRFLRVARGGFLGIGETHFLVPVDAVVDVADDAVHIDRDHEQAAAAPDYDPDLAATGRRTYWGGVYDYWGYAPFWSAGYIYPTFPFYPRRPDGRREQVDGEAWKGD